MDEYKKYTIGTQPCGKFKPSVLMSPSPYFCQIFSYKIGAQHKSTLKACLNCKNVHHENGYDSCDHYEELTYCACVKCLTEEALTNKHT